MEEGTTKTADSIEEGDHPLGTDHVQIDQIEAFLLLNIKDVLRTFVELQDLAALEVFIKHPQENHTKRIFRTGNVKNIWSEKAYSKDHDLISEALMKGKKRIINLPNRRFKSLDPFLQDRAFGQVLCYPIVRDAFTTGMICVAHTRKKFLRDEELDFVRSTAMWISRLIDYEVQNQRVRVNIVAEERERIGMDLHDGIIQSLYGIGLSLENARMSLNKGKGDSKAEIEKSIKALEGAIADIRAYILNLRPRQLRHSNLLDGMRSLIREFRANTMVEVELAGEDKDVEGLAKPQVDALYHIFQESLSNTAKHARATKVTIRLWREGDRVLLRVSDNGTGFEIAKSDRRIGHGLSNMRARAEGVGGGIEMVPIRKQGTTMRAWMPYIREGDNG